jgi:rhodanese-related sulfurtransferase
MIEALKNLFGVGPEVNYSELKSKGAQIIDVRSKGEYESGHIRGSVNIPLPSLENQLNKIRKDKPVITCCASGMRSSTAKSILQSKGYTEVYNGGGWSGLNQKLN